MSSSDSETAQSLVREGWNHLQLQRPLAAWASWRRALGYSPDFLPAREALDGLEQSPQLPEAARSALRFQPPAGPKRRRRWDTLFRDCDLEDLDDARGAFEQLTRDDPADADARYNYGVCLSWLGRNVEAVTTFDEVVRLRGPNQFERAVEAWTLAEVLRQGEGAETLADDLAYAWVLKCDDEEAEEIVSSWPGLQPVAPPINPATGQPQYPDALAFTWLDRPMPPPSLDLKAADLPRVLAQILKLPGRLRLSSPDGVGLDRVFANVMTSLGHRVQPSRREATPLPIVLLDAPLWSFRLPHGLPAELESDLARGAIEHYYENQWIHLPRRGLGDRSPVDAARAASAGDMVARAKLAAVVQFREQLGARPWAAKLYHGYPFDRLRRRLNLAPRDPATVDPEDYSCMNEGELARLDPATLHDSPLSAAYESAATLKDDRLTARFAAELTRRKSPALQQIDTPALVATLVREAMKGNSSDAALEWLDQARQINDGRDRRTFEVWSAEIHARTGSPAAAVQTYQELIDQDPENPVLALEAAETLLDNGYPGHARPFVERALDLAHRLDDQEAAERAEALLEQATLEPSDG